MPSAILVERSESEGERVKRCDALDLGGGSSDTQINLVDFGI